jgi:hypothetical protein
VPLPCWLGWNLALGHVREFICAVKAFALLTLVPTSSKTVYALQALHPSNSNFPYLDFLMDFHPNIDVELSMDSFRSVFLLISHLSIFSPLSIVFKHFQDFFDRNDSTSGFI